MAVSRTQAARALQGLLLKRVPTDQVMVTFHRFRERLDPGDQDRSVVLLASALLEQALEDAILTHCTPLLEDGDVARMFGGGVGGEGTISFAGKILLGFALDIYGRESMADLNRIRTIRNAFAHSRTYMDFSTQEIADLCDFGIVERIPWGSIVGPKPTTPKYLFIVICQWFIVYLSKDDGVPKSYLETGLGRIFS